MFIARGCLQGNLSGCAWRLSDVRQDRADCDDCQRNLSHWSFFVLASSDWISACFGEEALSGLAFA